MPKQDYQLTLRKLAHLNIPIDELTLDLFSEISAHGIEILNPHECRVFVSILETELKDLSTTLAELGFELVTADIVKKTNWLEKCSELWETLKIGKLSIRPTNNLSDTPKSDEILIVPGMGFGTGHHSTTKSIIELIEQEIPKFENPKIFDVGTGSGILALVAKHYGARKIIACDIDPLALDNAKDNLRLNQVEQEILLYCGPPNVLQDKFDIIFANLYSTLLLQYMDVFHDFLLPSGILFISGMMLNNPNNVNELEEVIYKYTANDWSLIDKKTSDNWGAALLRRSK